MEDRKPTKVLAQELSNRISELMAAAQLTDDELRVLIEAQNKLGAVVEEFRDKDYL